MPRRYDYLTERLGRWLLPLTHPYDWGEQDRKNGHPVAKLNREAFEMLVNGIRGIGRDRFHKKLTRTALQQHLRGDATVYYRGDSRSEHLLLNVDIDADASGAAEARRAAEYIARSVHRGAYHEPSTHGHGRHVYLRVERGRGTAKQWRRLLSRYVTALRAILAAKGIRATVDRVCGTPTVVTRVNKGWRTYAVLDGDFGVLSKVPALPDAHASMDRLEAAPTFTAKSFVAAVRRGERLQKGCMAPRGADGTENYSQSLMLTKPPGEASKTRVRAGVVAGIDPGAEPDAFLRMHAACKAYELRYGRRPDAASLVAFYEASGWHSGEGERDRRRRQRRAEEVVRYRAAKGLLSAPRTLDWPSLRHEMLAMVRRYVAPTHVTSVRCDRRVTEEDLAIGLFAVTLNATRRNPRAERQFTCGNDAVIGVFRHLRDAGHTERGCNLNKASAIRRVLAAAGLASFVSHRYVVGGPDGGVAKKLGLTEVHPLYDRFAALRDETPRAPKPAPSDTGRAEMQGDTPQTTVASAPSTWEALAFELVLAPIDACGAVGPHDEPVYDFADDG